MIKYILGWAVLLGLLLFNLTLHWPQIKKYFTKKTNSKPKIDLPKDDLINIKKLKPITMDYSDLYFLEDSQDLSVDEKVLIYYQKLFLLKVSVPLISLKGYSTQQLKEALGSHTFQEYLTYEDNYYKLLHTLNGWAEQLHKLGKTNEAVKVLEKSIALGSDLPKSFDLLSQYYGEKDFSQK